MVRGPPGSDLRSQQLSGLRASPDPLLAQVALEQHAPVERGPAPLVVLSVKSEYSSSSLAEGRGWTKRPCQAFLCPPRPSSPNTLPHTPVGQWSQESRGGVSRESGCRANPTGHPSAAPAAPLILPLTHIVEMFFSCKMGHGF